MIYVNVCKYLRRVKNIKMCLYFTKNFTKNLQHNCTLRKLIHAAYCDYYENKRK